MMRIYELYDKVPQAVLCLKKDDGSLTKVCDVKDIKPINPTYIPDKDDSMAYTNYIHKTQEVYKFKAEIDKLSKCIADCCSKTVNSYKLICTTIKHQNRTHHKYRTNKKWAKRYGYTYIEVQDDPFIFFDGIIYCTKDGLDQIKKICKKDKKHLTMI